MTPERIRRLRGSIAASQTDFGRMLNAHTVTVSRWENGRARPDRWTSVILRAMENNLADEPARAGRADEFLREDLWLHALAVLIAPVSALKGRLSVDNK